MKKFGIIILILLLSTSIVISASSISSAERKEINKYYRECWKSCVDVKKNQYDICKLIYRGGIDICKTKYKKCLLIIDESDLDRKDEVSKKKICRDDYKSCQLTNRNAYNDCRKGLKDDYTLCKNNCRDHKNYCLDIYEPVCGENGVTYPNDCFLDLTNQQKLCEGICPCNSNCVDSDGGRNYFEKGNYNHLWDTCIENHFTGRNVDESDILLEYIDCEPFDFDYVQCECRNGACVGPSICGDGLCNYDENQENCIVDCAYRCVDSDGGENYYKKGSVKGFLEKRNLFEYSDRCIEEPHVDWPEPWNLIEYLPCEGNKIKNKFYTCPNGCEDGACKNIDFDLSDYPEMFIKDEKFNGIIVVGQSAPALDVISATDIAVSLQYAIIEESNKIVPIEVGAVKIDNEVADPLHQNIITIGTPCVNSVTAQLMGNPENCIGMFDIGDGLLKLYYNNGYYQLVVTGYSKEDVRRAAKVLAEYYKYDLRGYEREIDSSYEVECHSSDDCPSVKRYCNGNNACQTITSYSCQQGECVKTGGGGGGCLTCPNGCRDGYCISDGIDIVKAEYKKAIGPGTDALAVEFRYYGDGEVNLSQYDLIFTGNGYSIIIDNVQYLSKSDYIEGYPIMDHGSIKYAYVKGGYTAPLFDHNKHCNELIKVGLIKKDGTSAEDILILRNIELDCFEASCVDTDEGKDYYNKGYVKVRVGKGDDGTHFDACYGDEIAEYYCNEDYTLGSINFLCPNGCKDGACIDPIVDIECYSDADCPDQIDHYCNSANNACTKSTRYQCKNPGTADSKCESVTSSAGCKTCRTGCQNGFCIQPTYKCKDSDGGDYFYEKGTVTKGTKKYTDYCKDNNNVVEYLCKDSITTNVHNYYCIYGCENGACIKGPTSKNFIIKGSLVDIYTLKPLSNVKIDLLDSMGGWNKIETQYTGLLGEFKFRVPEYTYGYLLSFRPDCYHIGGVVGELNDQDEHEFFLFTTTEHCNYIKVPIINGIVDMGQLKIQPAADLEFTSDVPVSHNVYYESLYCDHEIGGAGNKNKKMEGFQKDIFPLGYNSWIVLNEGDSSEIKSDYHYIPKAEGCYKVKVDYNNGEFTWSDLIPKYQQTCTDSDGGKDYYEKGVTEGMRFGSPQTVWTDNCATSEILSEYSCVNDMVDAISYTCPNGCNEGKCIGDEPSCIDTDGGINLYEVGKAVSGNKFGSVDVCSYLKREKGILREGVCKDSKNTHLEIICPDTKPYCNRAVCSATPPTCKDTDGGIYPYDVGTITEPRHEDGPEYKDYCQNINTKQPWNNCYGEECGVREFYCTNPYVTTTFKDVHCPNGCKDGACIGEIINPEDYLPNKCVSPPGFTCTDFIVKANEIQVMLRNGLGFDMSDINVSLENCGSSSSPSTLNKGDTGTWSVTCSPELTGSLYDGDLEITYTLIDTGITHTVFGEVVSRIKS